MYKTKIDLSEKTRRNVIAILNDRLADAIDLQSQVKQAHWNVKGPNFIALHELFDKISDLVLEQIDTIAERVTSLGGTAEGTVAVAAKRSKLKNYPLSITAGKDHLFYLSTQLSVFGKAVRAAIDDTDRLGRTRPQRLARAGPRVDPGHAAGTAHVWGNLGSLGGAASFVCTDPSPRLRRRHQRALYFAQSPPARRL